VHFAWLLVHLLRKTVVDDETRDFCPEPETAPEEPVSWIYCISLTTRTPPLKHIACHSQHLPEEIIYIAYDLNTSLKRLQLRASPEEREEESRRSTTRTRAAPLKRFSEL
jgi:hypothetical protein